MKKLINPWQKIFKKRYGTLLTTKNNEKKQKNSYKVQINLKKNMKKSKVTTLTIFIYLFYYTINIR